MFTIQFPDRIVPYDKFIGDIAARVARLMQSDEKDPEFVSQRKAYSMFGRGNVDCWRSQRKVTAYKRPGKVEYRTADLRLLQRVEQDYFKDSE